MSRPSVIDVVGTGIAMVTGAGVSGLGTARLLTGLGVEVLVVDDNVEAGARVAEATGAESCTTAEAMELLENLEHRVSVVVTSPGWRPDTPVLRLAEQHEIEVIGDVELAYRLDRAGLFGPPRTWLVVTGTNGKTTTTGMLADIMEAHASVLGQHARACGNIGLAVADALTATRPRVDVLVAELSSFQLHWSTELTPDAGVLLNIAEDHLDWHGSLDNYASDKAKVLTGVVAVAGVDDPIVRRHMRQVRPDAYGFTLGEPAVGQVGVIGEQIIDNLDGDMIDIRATRGIQPAGPAGLADALAATAIARTQGVAPATIARALDAFSVAGHRGETVHTGPRGTVWVDNSKATNPHAAHAALAGYGPGEVVWLAGGQLKGASVDEVVAENAERLRAVGLLGVDRARIAEAVTRGAPEAEVFMTDSTDPAGAMDELVCWAARLEPPAKVVLLAPAAASLDMYTGMGQRGDLFTAAARREDRLKRSDPATGTPTPFQEESRDHHE
ncbi:UDP-N-acetylmuramoyl-L-alanine--D-glutamate ligase [Corynebacterium guangdongense]|nr:UDP-N-acetylmuramoyl-L-alanine--D-glutamate ligase [Corynebacterium guangdongense]WJZ18304.1 UDP-N-acetylmuramoylalanine--D-glutamate ligase [Corynebacterium guangdongense]